MFELEVETPEYVNRQEEDGEEIVAKIVLSTAVVQFDHVGCFSGGHPVLSDDLLTEVVSNNFFQVRIESLVKSGILRNLPASVSPVVL